MTIEAAASEIVYLGDGVTVAFPITFPFDTSADIGVVVTDTSGTPSRITTGFAITGGGGLTGTCTFSVAPTSGYKVTIFDDPELTQPVDYIANDSFPAETHEKALDRVTRITKRQEQRIDRSLRVEDGDDSSGDALLLPIEANRKGNYLAFDADGNPIASAGTGNDTALRTDLATNAVGSQGSRLVGTRRAETGARSRTIFEILDYDIGVSVFNFLSPSAVDGTTDNTAGIQAWLNCGAKKLYLPYSSQPYRASNLTQRVRSTIAGDAKRGSVVRQLTTASGPLLATETGLPPSGGTTDISDGGYGWQDLCLQPRALAGCHGINMAGGVYGMLRAHGLRIQSQQSESHVSTPYAIVPGQYGINVSGAGGAVALFNTMSDLEIRGFDVAFRARSIVNEMHLQGWFIDNKCSFDVQTVSSWQTHITNESGVANACSWRMDGPCANLHIWDKRHELTQIDSYIAEFMNAASPDFSNVHIWLPNILIPSDGSGWPGRKYLASDGVRGVSNGTLPPGVFFHVMTGTSPNYTWLNIGASASTQEFSPTVRVGGLNKGNGKAIFGRNLGGADSTIEHDGSNLKITAGNYTEFADAGGSATSYLHAVKFGSYYVYIDSAGKLRLKGGAPASDGDGTVVGTQT